jgi:hypothetical protein
MITSLSTSLVRVILFWYIVGALALFLGDPAWAEAMYLRLAAYPWVPEFEMHGINTAAAVQWRLLVYWTAPMLLVWVASVGLGVLVAEIQCQLGLRKQRSHLKPLGEFWKVTVAGYSIGRLPPSTTPALTGQSVTLGGTANPKGDESARVELKGAMKDVVKMLTPAERQLAEELLQLLLQSPDHFAGLGHGVGLLEHTLNVVAEAAAKVTPEFRLPMLAALSHDIGKLITFQPDGQGGWKKRGLHSRESARILATLPGFQELPELHQRALLLAVKYDHAPSKMPELRGERDASTLAMRVISALAMADRKATADEKERHLERLQPEDLLWKDFVDFLREAPVVQRGKKGAANQVNNPPDNPYLYVYEAPWRDAAVRRLPDEVAAALDLTRRDAGKMAKYTRYLVERLRKEGLLLEEYSTKDKDGNFQELKVSDSNPLWDIQSGTGEKAVVLRGIIVLRADELWKKLNYRISVKSPFPVQILAPNADPDGRVNDAPRANREEPRTPDVSDGLKLADVDSTDAMASLGLTSDPADEVPKTGKPKTRARGGFKPAPAASPADDAVLGLKTGGTSKPVVAAPVAASAPASQPDGMDAGSSDAGTTDHVDEVEVDQEALERAEMEAAMASDAAPPDVEESTASTAMDNALSYLNFATDPVPEPAAADAEASIDATVSAPAAEQVPASTEPPPAAVVATASSRVVAPAPTATEKERPDAPKKPKVEGKRPSPDKAPAPAPAPAKQVTSAPKATTPEPAPAPSPAPAQADPVAELSRAEKREGLAVADEAAVAKFPGLALGDKFYTEHSRAVQAGLKKPGSRYKGDNREKALDLTDSGPRRGRRRLTS